MLKVFLIFAMLVQYENIKNQPPVALPLSLSANWTSLCNGRNFYPMQTQINFDVEIWKDIDVPEGQYQVSDLGRAKMVNGILGREIILKGHLSGAGYYTVRLKKNGESNKHYIHKLVAIAFVPKVEGKTCVDHINGDKLDNRAENLRWCTHRENTSFGNVKRSKPKTSSYVGVSWSASLNKWLAHIYYEGKVYRLGAFVSETEAAECYRKATRDINNASFIIPKPKQASCYKGVCWDKRAQRWNARITLNGKQVFNQMFYTEHEAHESIIEFKKTDFLILGT